MSMLFDISPNEPVRKSSRKSRVSPATRQEKQEPEKGASYIRTLPPRAIKAIGRIDHLHECPDTRCRGSAHDIIHEDCGEWLIQCCFCNTGQWVPVIKDHLPDKQKDEFVFRDGRFAGLSISEAWDQPRGQDYVRWCAESHPRPAVKQATKTWLDQKQQRS